MCATAESLKSSLVYQHLVQNTEIVEVPEPDMIEGVPEVPMDYYAITERGRIGTLGVHTCFAVCCQGTRTKDGHPILGLAHVSIQSIHKVHEIIARRLVRAGCDQMTIKTYVVGGMLTCEDGETTCPEQEQDVLNRAEHDRIVGARFNIVKETDESLSVLFTPNRVQFSKEDLFEPSKEIGTPLDA